MHKHHFIGCGVMLAAALLIFAATGGSAGGLGFVLVALLCPIAMGVVMWLLMGSQHRPTRDSADSTSEPSERDVPSGL